MPSEPLQTELIDRLVRYGLGQGEARCYVAMLAPRAFKVSEVARAAGLPRSRSYELIRSLVRSGLCSEVAGGRVARFRAAPPNEAIGRLEAFLAEQELRRKAALMTILSALDSRESGTGGPPRTRARPHASPHRPGLRRLRPPPGRHQGRGRGRGGDAVEARATPLGTGADRRGRAHAGRRQGRRAVLGLRPPPQHPSSDPAEAGQPPARVPADQPRGARADIAAGLRLHLGAGDPVRRGGAPGLWARTRPPRP